MTLLHATVSLVHRMLLLLTIGALAVTLLPLSPAVAEDLAPNRDSDCATDDEDRKGKDHSQTLCVNGRNVRVRGYLHRSTCFDVVGRFDKFDVMVGKIQDLVVCDSCCRCGGGFSRSVTTQQE